jgi:hypothetical protein
MGNSTLLVAQNLGDSRDTVEDTYIDTDVWRIREHLDEKTDEEMLAGLVR